MLLTDICKIIEKSNQKYILQWNVSILQSIHNCTQLLFSYIFVQAIKHEIYRDLFGDHQNEKTIKVIKLKVHRQKHHLCFDNLPIIFVYRAHLNKNFNKKTRKKHFLIS